MRPLFPEPRLGFAFTERDTPELRARITRDLRHVTRRAVAADPALVAIVLTGGFSRGEGTSRKGEPVNDYDLIAVRSRPGRGPYRALGHELTQEVGLEVDIMPIWTQRLRYVGRKIFWLDLRLGGQTLWGDELQVLRIPRFEPEDVSRGEIARLLGNRAAGMLLAIPGPGEAPDPYQRDLQATKAALAAMDATLLSQGKYAVAMRDRLALLEGHEDHGVFRTAVQWKLREGSPLPDDWWDRARDALLRAVDATRAREARDGLAEHALHLLRAHRIAASPSQAVRRVSWDMLSTCAWPDGPAGVVWAQKKGEFIAARRRTLQ